MKNENTLYWLWLALKCDIASKDFNQLIEKYDDPFDIYRLEEAEIEQFSTIGKKVREKLCEKDLDASYEILKFCKRERVDIISYGDTRYPERLKSLIDPPIVLYCKGHFPDFNMRLCIGVVGTRRMSEYGKQSAYKIAYELASAGALTVSGMAKGIDGVSACGALAAGGQTVAVLGCGIDRVYPSEHKKLMAEIMKHGAVITEYPPKEAPHGYNFPKRNRIISGLCQGVLIVEAPVGSGALITARDTIGQGRELFALPGNIDDANAQGPNELIKEGAYPVLSSRDILEHYEFLYGDSYDEKALELAKRRFQPIGSALKKYGLSYALSLENEEKIEIKQKSESKKIEEKTIEEKSAPTKEAQDYDRILSKLDSVTQKIFRSLPQDKAVSADAVVGDGISTAEAITSLTLLELEGLVSSLPGGLYIRK